MRREYAWRSMLVIALLPFFALTVLGQMVRIQNSPEAKLFIAQAEANAMVLRTFYPERGEIYDRGGHLLAGNETVYTVGVNIQQMEDAHAIASTLSAHLGLDYNDTYQTLLNPYGLTFLTFKQFVSSEEATALIQEQEQKGEEALANNQPSPLSGLELRPSLQRRYPENALASNVIGFVNREGFGSFGVEGKYDGLLAGNQVQALVPRDPNRAGEIPKVPNGTTLIFNG
jgi:penicillin-binding protein 2B